LQPSEQVRAAFRGRQSRLASWLRDGDLFACVVEDFENGRSQNLRWLCGQPTDAILVVFAAGRSVLVPWDVNLAAEMAVVDEVIPYTDFKRSYREAVASVLRGSGLEGGSTAGRRVELCSRTPFLRHKDLAADMPSAEIVVRNDGLDAFLGRARAVKDEAESAAVQKAADITNSVIEAVESTLVSTGAAGLREFDVAQMVEREALSRGAEGLGFETLAAGPSRSWAIHPFPVCTRGPFGGPGLSILDFGIRVDGYTSDVTLTVARGRLDPVQERMVALVEKAYAAAVGALRPGGSPRDPALRADEVFSEAGLRMPHALGHGIGLEAHESPLLRSQAENADAVLAPGMVFTIEPGLYDPGHGGVRWENDVLMTAGGPRILTKARILRLA
jgi:Xaa-Pro dipeptidase